MAAVAGLTYVALLIAETVPVTAIRARPGDVITGHPPHVFLHAQLTNSEPAPARPDKTEILLAATATLRVLSFPVIRVGRIRFCPVHSSGSHSKGDTDSSIRNRTHCPVKPPAARSRELTSLENSLGNKPNTSK